jgi:hypothetical protein
LDFLLFISCAGATGDKEYRSTGTSAVGTISFSLVGTYMAKWNRDSFDNELLAAIIAVALAGFITMVLWAVFSAS